MQFALSEEEELIRESARKLAGERLAPLAERLDRGEGRTEFLANLKLLAENGFMALNIQAGFGGTEAGTVAFALALEELAAACASTAVTTSVTNMVGEVIQAVGTSRQQADHLPKLADGTYPAGAFCLTESGAGSDPAGMKLRARRDGDDYVLDGEKIYITSGMRADWLTVAVRTGGSDEKGARGISLLLVPGDSAGLTRTPLRKMGWWCSDTAQLHFDGVRVPARYLLGEEGAGFRMVMGNFNGERLGLAASALGFAQACLDEALAWARQRHTFGSPLIGHQAVRHRLADMQMRIAATEAWLDAVAAQGDALEAGGQVNAPAWVADVCLLKNQATQTMQFCADAAVQILGGMGYMRGTVSERIYREVKVMMIGGGAEEIMKELAARQLGWM